MATRLSGHGDVFSCPGDPRTCIVGPCREAAHGWRRRLKPECTIREVDKILEPLKSKWRRGPCLVVTREARFNTIRGFADLIQLCTWHDRRTHLTVALLDTMEAPLTGHPRQERPWNGIWRVLRARACGALPLLAGWRRARSHRVGQGSYFVPLRDSTRGQASRVARERPSASRTTRAWALLSSTQTAPSECFELTRRQHRRRPVPGPPEHPRGHRGATEDSLPRHSLRFPDQRRRRSRRCQGGFLDTASPYVAGRGRDSQQGHRISYPHAWVARRRQGADSFDYRIASRDGSRARQ